MYKVIAILVNNEGKTVGARLISKGKGGKGSDLSTEQLQKMRETLPLVNATIDKNGFVRSKPGFDPLKREVTGVPADVEAIIDKWGLPLNVLRTNMNWLLSQQVLNNSLIQLYCGTKDKEFNIVTREFRGALKLNENLGVGSHIIPDKKLAQEWAWQPTNVKGVGWLYQYILHMNGLKVLNFTELDTLCWVAEVMSNKKILEYCNTQKNTLLLQNAKQLIKKYKINTSKFDLLIGYDVEYTCLCAMTHFLNGKISKERLDKVLYTSEYGIQFILNSVKAGEGLVSRMTPINVSESFKKKSEARGHREFKKFTDMYYTSDGPTRINDYV